MFNFNKAVLGVALFLSASVAFAGNQVPFDLRASATSLTPPVFIGTHMYLTASGTGTASHMGTLSFVAPHDFDLADGTYVSDAIVTGANGDSIEIITNGQFIDAVDSIGDWTIVGGTGRFAGATGSGTALNLNFGQTITLTGTISSVGSGK